MRPQNTPAKSTATPRLLAAAAAVAAVMALTACSGTMPTLGGGGTVATGAAGGANSSNASSQLEKCEKTLGTLAVHEDTSATWYHHLSEYKLGSTIPVLRTMIQQSNCFVIVERGAVMNNMRGERALEESGEVRGGSNFGKGQMVAADYTMNPSITFSQKGTSGLSGSLAGFGVLGSALSMVAGGLKANEAATTLIMVDNRSGIQLAAAEGSAKNYDFNVMGGMFTGGMWGSAGGYSNTPEGKILIASFMDSYNQMVKAVRNYKAQEVAGGMGTGGGLGVQGGTTPASVATTQQPASKSAQQKSGKTVKK